MRRRQRAVFQSRPSGRVGRLYTFGTAYQYAAIRRLVGSHASLAAVDLFGLGGTYTLHSGVVGLSSSADGVTQPFRGAMLVTKKMKATAQDSILAP